MSAISPRSKRAVIIGGGVAGSLATIALAKLPRIGSITLLDRSGAFGRGLAYSAQATWHRINVPAYKMAGIGADDPEGFADWLRETGQDGWPDFSASFVPRQTYGDYIEAKLSEAMATDRVTTRQAAVAQISRRDDIYDVITESGEHIETDLVILCLGNPPPAPFPGVAPSPRSVTDVWAPGALDGIGLDDTVLVIGTGATAVDVVIDLVHRGMRKPITMVSRRGLLPLIDEPAQTDPKPLEIWPVPTARGIFAALLQDTRRKMAAGIPWQTTIDTFRLQIAGMWTNASREERERFSRHLRSIWLVHRHRLAPDVAHLLDDLRADGRLNLVAGRIAQASATPHGHDVTIRKRSGGTSHLATGWILNCTGPEERYDRIANPLVKSLLGNGLARVGQNGLGFDVNGTCRLLDSHGQVQTDFYAIGHATRGAFWEVTAATSIRQQMLAVAETIATSD